jgi:hypothetical protein
VSAQPPAGSLEPFAGLRIHRLLTSGDRRSILGIWRIHQLMNSWPEEEK